MKLVLVMDLVLTMIGLMGWIKEAKIVTQKMYGGYCNMCRELGIEPIPYNSFKDDPMEYNNVRETYLTFKRKYR